MIVSDEHRFIFVHIPKCAGTAIREQIAQFDSEKAYFTQVKRHPVFGRLDYGHIPLDVLAEHWAEVFEKLRSYRSFAVMRDPLARFGSSLRQTLHFYSKRYTTEMTADDARSDALRLIERIEAADDLLDPTLAFFLPQVRFICFNGEKFVTDVHDVANLVPFYRDLSTIVGATFDIERKANRDLSFRTKMLVRPAYAVNAWLYRNAPRQVRDTVKRLALPLLTHEQGATARAGLLDDPEIKAFVARFYADDIAMYDTLRQSAQAGA